ncbi:hypothetical protein [Pseudonocardia sp. 73-21]|uniref:hypothetical protein n=1 Tax=Pseudonocardia sp. 73-21 TaxID=1895809 RepID=UPI00095FCB90|nr:hypothetical protein [Pseudonocardia sp. 73-21]OJY43764.1 MAG: hypothetical protein BGP03_07605 [Pseudonocardia sp. 73-21]
MVMLCERCFSPVEDGEENVVSLAHIDTVLPDGSITWNHAYVHTAGCTEPRVPEHQRPDTGTWDSSRGIQSRRQH